MTHAPRGELVAQMTAEDIRSLMLVRIGAGTYRLGDRLPSVRALSTELGANRNTASKVYRQLRQEGVLESQRGKGVFLVALPRRRSTDPYERLAVLLRCAFSYASLASIPQRRLRQLIGLQLRELNGRQVRIAFVECNPYEAREIAARMQHALGYPVDPFFLDNVAKTTGLLRDYPVIATTLYHLSEVQEYLRDRRLKVVGLHHSPSTDSILRIARLEPGTRIAVIATNRRTLNVLLKITETYHNSVVGSCLTDRPEDARDLLARSDAIIVHPLARRLLPKSARKRVITVTFQIESQSLDYLRQSIGRITHASEKTT